MTAAVATERRPRRPYLAPVPDSEPPFDADDGSGRRPTKPSARRRPPRQAPVGLPSAGAIGGPAATIEAAARSVACAAVPSWSSEPDIGVRRTATAHLPSAHRAAQVLATALVEVLAERRPVGQLRVHSAPQVFAGLVMRASDGPLARAQLMSVRACQPADGVAEVSATVRHGKRVRALAFRLEGIDGRWRITALDIG